jgi:hypothetical protein
VFALETELALSLFEGLGTVRALTCSLLLRYKEYDQLISLVCDPLHYNDVNSFQDDYLATLLLSKNPRIPLSTNKEEVAIRKFREAEKLCFDTNRRIRVFREDPRTAGQWAIKLVTKTQQIIQRILGSHPSQGDLSYCYDKMRFGPGATTSCGGIVTSGRKFSKRDVDCTSSMVSFRAFCFPHLWKQNVPGLNVRESSRLTTVPKNAKTDRVICIEPDLNIFFQLGVGALLRQKLRYFGLDLSTQEVNRSFARRALKDNLATVDLSSASDTISTEIVELLIPPAWVDLLRLPRVSSTTLPDGEIVDLEKWSSMGNGYTFELETLIFYATALAVTEFERWSDVTSFGDDIILPSSSYPDLREALEFLGFKVNAEKSFGNGLFYESCGTDWFDGINVRPFFLKSDSHDINSICYLYANNARRWSCRRNGGDSCDGRLLPFWLRCFAACQPNARHHIPEGYGDVGFISDFDRACPKLTSRARRRTTWGGYFFYYRRIGMRKTASYVHGAYIGSLCRSNTSEWTLGNEDLRGRPMPARRKIGYSLEWPNLGPWC